MASKEQLQQQQRDAFAELVRSYGGTAEKRADGYYKMRGQIPWEAQVAFNNKWNPILQSAQSSYYKPPASSTPPAPAAPSTPELDSQSVLDNISLVTKSFEDKLAEQAQTFQTQLAAQQKQAQEAQRQLMINMQRGDRAPAAVKTTSSAAEKAGLTRRGTTGYFGRRGMRIGSLNVPSTGLAIAPNMQMPASGSFA